MASSSVGVLSKAILNEEVGKLTRSIGRMVLDSLRADGIYGDKRTRKEVQHRFDICIELYKTLRGEYKYSTERALDAVPAGLRARLDNLPWQPSTRPWWFGHDKAELQAAGIDFGDIFTDESAPLVWTPDRARYGVM